MGGALGGIGRASPGVFGPGGGPAPGGLGGISRTNPKLQGIVLPEVTGFGMTTAALPTLACSRVALRPLDDRDEQAWRELVDRNHTELVGLGFEAVVEDFSAAIERRDVEAQLGLCYEFVVEHDGALVGYGALPSVQWCGPASALVSVWLDRGSIGHGLGQAVYLLLCRFAFDDLGLHRVEAAVLTDNAGVQRALEKLDIPNRGLEERYLEVDGEWRDHYRYIVTAEEWNERRATLEAAWLD